jgi:hypothetical protein
MKLFIHKKSSPKKEIFLLIFVEILENQTLMPTIAFLLQNTTQGVLCILIPQQLKIFKLKFEIMFFMLSSILLYVHHVGSQPILRCFVALIVSHLYAPL